MIAELESDTILWSRYKLTHIVGQGGMGKVYRAEDLRLPGRLCAIKEVRPEPNASPKVREQEQAQFLREASLLAQLDHRIKLVDFGLAKLLLGDGSSTITVIQGRGTAFYTPIEQYGAESEHTDVRSDIYAMGATFFHLISGHPPPEAKERFLNPSVMKRLRSINARVKKSISETIHWALEMHPDDRPTSIAEFRLALHDGRIRGSNKSNTREEHLWPAFKSNLTLMLITLLLFVLAMVLTLP